MELTRIVRRETFLEAVFLCSIPFLAALSISDTAFFRATRAPSAFFSATIFSTFFIKVFRAFFTALFFSVSTFDCLALLRTDLLLLGAAFAGNLLPSLHIEN